MNIDSWSEWGVGTRVLNSKSLLWRWRSVVSHCADVGQELHRFFGPHCTLVWDGTAVQSSQIASLFKHLPPTKHEILSLDVQVIPGKQHDSKHASHHVSMVSSLIYWACWCDADCIECAIPVTQLLHLINVVRSLHCWLPPVGTSPMDYRQQNLVRPASDQPFISSRSIIPGPAGYTDDDLIYYCCVCGALVSLN